MSQNAQSQSDCRIRKLAITQEEFDLLNLIFNMQIKTQKIQKLVCKF